MAFLILFSHSRLKLLQVLLSSEVSWKIELDQKISTAPEEHWSRVVLFGKVLVVVAL